MTKNENVQGASKPGSVSEYIDAFPAHQRSRLTELRKVLKDLLPEANEELKWGNPAITAKDGMILVIYAGYRQHMNLVATPGTRQALEKELAGYKTGKGSVQLSYEEALPVSLIKKIVDYRAREYYEQDVKWKS